jgi:sulfofructose kinase
MSDQSPAVIGLGFCAYDRIYRVAAYPPLGGKTRILETFTGGGGQVATALVALSRLGIATRFIGCRGDDEEGEQIERELSEAGVDIAGLITVRGASSQQSFIVVPRKGGERSIFWRRSPAIDLTAEKVDPAWFPEAPHILLIDGHEKDACLRAAHITRERGGRVVLDAEYCEPRSAELLALVDDLVADATFADKFLPGTPWDGTEAGLRERAKALREFGPGRVVITLGERGAVSWDGETWLAQPAFDVPVVDTTGAGDIFHAGYCHGLLAGLADGERLRFACAMAGLKCRAPGGREGIPTLAEIEALLAGNRLRPRD